MASQAAYPQQELVQLIQSWERRLRIQKTVFWLPRAILPGVVAGIMLLVLARYSALFAFSSLEILLFTALAVLAGLLVMLGLVWLRPRSTLDSARRFDISFNLGERISTALELIEGRIHSSEELVSHQINDAWTRGQTVDASDKLPLKWDKRAWITVGVGLLVLFILLILPAPEMGSQATAAPGQAAIDEAAEVVERITQEIAADTSLTDEERQELLQQLDRASDILEEESVTPEEAFAALTDAQTELQEQAESMNQQLQQQQEGLQAASDAIEESTQPGGEQNSSQSMSQAIEQAQQQMGEQSQEQMLQLAENLEQAANAIEESNPELAEALREAAEALRNGDMEAAQEAMQEAAEMAQEQQQEMEQQQQAAEQMQQGANEMQEAGDQVAQQSSQQSGQQQAQDSQSGEFEAEPQEGNANPQEGEQGQQPGGEGEQQSQGSQQSDSSGAIEQINPAPGTSGTNMQQQTTGAGAGDDSGGEGADLPSSQSDQIAQDNDPDGQGEREFAQVYAPRRLGGEGGPEIILEPDASDAAVSEGEFIENPSGESLVPYNQVFSDYSNAANRALDSDYIPLGLRDVVRDYFSSLEPGQQRP